MKRTIIMVILLIVLAGVLIYSGSLYGRYTEKLGILDRIEEVDKSRKATDAKVSKYTDSERCRIAGGKLSKYGDCE